MYFIFELETDMHNRLFFLILMYKAYNWIT